MKGRDRVYRIYSIEESRPGYGVPLTTIEWNGNEWASDSIPLENIFDREWLKNKIIEVSGPEKIFPRRILGDGVKSVTEEKELNKIESLAREAGYDHFVSRIFAYWFVNICRGYCEREEDYPSAATRRKNRGKLKKYCEGIASFLEDARLVYGGRMEGEPLLPQAFPTDTEIINGMDTEAFRRLGYACNELKSSAENVLKILREVESLDSVKKGKPWDGRADLVLSLAAAYYEILGEMPKTTDPEFIKDVHGGNLFYSIVIEAYDSCLLSCGNKKSLEDSRCYPTKNVQNAVKTYSQYLKSLSNNL